MSTGGLTYGNDKRVSPSEKKSGFFLLLEEQGGPFTATAVFSFVGFDFLYAALINYAPNLVEKPVPNLTGSTVAEKSQISPLALNYLLIILGSADTH